ncbi:hypothetical protein HanIR_Chr13g0618751 [Helianthus annuus]|nr:hypothetical protein HanIR_Chr13g0618751 [Helianthus annuus]
MFSLWYPGKLSERCVQPVRSRHLYYKVKLQDSCLDWVAANFTSRARGDAGCERDQSIWSVARSEGER